MSTVRNILKYLLLAVQILAALLVVAVGLFVILWVVEDIRMERKVQEIRAWVQKELPVGSAVPRTFQVLRAHGVKEENMRYNERSKSLTASLPRPFRFMVIDGAIHMHFRFDDNERLLTADVKKEYSFL